MLTVNSVADRRHVRRSVPDDRRARRRHGRDARAGRAPRAQAATGYAASVIGCDAEAGIERELSPDETPDGRPGVSLLFFGFSRDALQKAVVNRVAQCVLTCATTACYNGLAGDAGKSIKVGGQLRYFGDGWQISKLLDGKRYWRMPTMDGEFLCEESFGTVKGVGGGNFLILGETQSAALAAAEAAVAAIRTVPGVILPFPGGIVRAGSKVGSKYKGLKASTNDAYCPTLRGAVKSAAARGRERGVRNRLRRPRPRGGREGDAGGHRGRVPAGRREDHRRQLRRQARPAPHSSAQALW